MPETSIDTFFYGLFMDPEVLREHDLAQRVGRKAVAPGFRLVIGRRAALAPEAGAQAFGMVFALEPAELAKLYGAPGLELYRPRPILVVYEDASSALVSTYDLESPALAGEPDPVYAAKLRAVLQRLGLPFEHVRVPTR